MLQRPSLSELRTLYRALQMETQSIRLRVMFEDRSVLSQTQRSEGMNQTWLLIEPQQHRKISDVCNHLLHTFNLRRSCPNGILLYMEGFLLPPSESTRILKDKEIICVKRKGMALADAIEAADEPVNSGMLLLANEEFDKETGGYKSESEETKEEKLEEEPSPIETVSKKRKASTKLRSSNKKIKRNKEKGISETETIIVKVKSSPKVKKRKKKHHLAVVSGGEDKVVTDEIHNIDDDDDEALTGKTISKKKTKPNKELNKGDTETSDKKVKSFSSVKRSEHLEDNVEGVEQETTELDGAKKGPSRSARRKKAKRQWIRELAKISDKPVTQQPETEVSKAENKEANGHPKEVIKQDEVPKKVVHKYVIQEEERKSNGNVDTEFVACVVRPGHIRFEPLEEDEGANQMEVVPDVGFQWNGITSKKKGQKWGLQKEKYSTSRKDDDFQKPTEEPSPILTTDTQVPVVDLNDFDNLPLCTSPKEGDVIAYRLVELSSLWTPELSSFRVGKISHYHEKNIVLKPVPEYPIVLDKPDEDGPDNVSLYKEDGSLEIEFAGLVDVRSVKQSNSDDVKAVSNGGNHKDANEKKANTSPKSHKEGETWEEVMEVLREKKSQLMEAKEETKKETGWNRWSYRALRSSALGPTMALLRSNENL